MSRLHVHRLVLSVGVGLPAACLLLPFALLLPSPVAAGSRNQALSPPGLTAEALRCGSVDIVEEGGNR